jgi:hypothetical protein
MSTSKAEEALWRLARHLYEAMEQLDPLEIGGWESLSKDEKDFYYFALKDVLKHGRDDVLTWIEAGTKEASSG